MSTTEFKWLPIPPDFWVPAGLKDFQEAWFINLLRASLRSENMGYLILCEEGCSGCSACLWRVANAHRPEHFKKHSSLVLACFNSAQIAGRRVIYFPKLVETINGQISKMKKCRRSRGGAFSEESTGFNNGNHDRSPSESLSFDFDLDFKDQNQPSSNACEVLSMNTGTENPSERVPRQQLPEFAEGANRILRILGLPESLLPAAIAAVEAEAKQTKLSMDGIVQRIATEANRAERVGIATEDFLSDFLAGKFARRILEVLNLPVNTNFIVRATAVMKAEAKDTGLPMDEVASRITQAATEDRRRGERIDIFYLEDVRWRSNARASKAEQRKLGNLAANARAKEILRERFR